MGKELTPLEALEELKDRLSYECYDENCIKIIETALKRIPELEKELCFIKTIEDLTIEAIKDKKLKALEIIKEKITYRLTVCNNKYYLELIDGYDCVAIELTQEEYDLLKGE